MALSCGSVPIIVFSALLSRLVAFLGGWRWFCARRVFQFTSFGHFDAAWVLERREPIALGAGESGHESREEDAQHELSREDRVAQLVARLMSSDVRVPEAAEVGEVPLCLSDEEVERVFIDHVPGVEGFLFRGQRGNYSLKFLVSCYKDGLRAFRGTDLHEHLLWLFRLVVHHGEAGGLEAAGYLREVAEAFQECQAVQARAIERAGLRIRGVAADFPGLLARLSGEYKTIAVQMLAAQHVVERCLREDPVPTHYANRLTADLGQELGLNADDVRRAALDHLAAERFAPLGEADVPEAAARCRELLDADAMFGAFVAEVNGFNADSAPESLSRLFLAWASERLAEKHAVLDEHTCTRVEVTPAFALAVFEDVFFGRTRAPSSEHYRGQQLRTLFLKH